MSIKYNNQYVDEKYLPIVEPNLYVDSVIIPGVTCTDKYVTGPAGQIFAHKLTKGIAEPGTPGRDFTDEETKDELVAIAINNDFQKSKKIYGVHANAVDVPLAEENLAEAVAVVADGRVRSALACMAHEGTADSDTTAIASADAATEKLLALRKMIKDNYGKANFALVSTECYKYFLSTIGMLYNGADEATKNGELLNRFGLNIIECNAFDKDSKYYDYAGTLQTEDLSNVEMIVGYNESFAVVPNLEALRIKDSERFVGSLAQVEMNVGFRVTNPAQIVVKKKVA